MGFIASIMEKVSPFLISYKWYIILGVLLLTFIIQGLITSKINKSIYGRDSIFAWIPFLNIYTLGKVCADEIVGIILAAMTILIFRLTLPINGIDKTFALLPKSTYEILLPYCLFMIGCLYIYSIFKFLRLRKEKKGKV